MSKPGAIVAIGGGDMGWKGEPVTTTPIDWEVLALTGKTKPKVLFVPTAKRDSELHVEVFERQYRDNLDADVRVLYLYEYRPSQRITEDLIAWADVIYVGGGNTLLMLMRWRALGIDSLLIKANKRGTVLAGMSAGAQCWFEYGLTDCWRLDHDPAKAIAARGLGLIPGMCNPHYHTDTWRTGRGKEVLKKIRTVGINIDDNTALIVKSGSYRIVTSTPKTGVSHSLWKNGQYFEELVAESGPLSTLTYAPALSKSL